MKMIKRQFKKVSIMSLLSILFLTIKAQAPIQEGGSDYPEDLWHLKNVGIGSSDRPDARLHIFNGLTDLITPGYRSTRPFLISGFNKIIINTLSNGTVIYGNEPKDYFTVDPKGFVGIDVLNPFTKMHLHNGIFTISEGKITEPSANWQIAGTQSAFSVKDQLAQKYRFWINKSDGFVGIGTESPIELLEVENGNIQVNNGNMKIIDGSLEIKDGSVINFKVGPNGAVRARRIDVDLQAIPDYVFKADYKLMPLEDLKKFIEEKKHLPNIKSEQDYYNAGSLDITELNLKLLEKVEELTLYVINLQEQLKAQQAQLNLLK